MPFLATRHTATQPAPRSPIGRLPRAFRCMQVAFGRMPRHTGSVKSRVALWFVAGLWAFFGLITGFQVWLSMITHGHSVPRLVGYYVAIYEGWLLITLAIVWLARRFPLFPFSRTHTLIHMFAACAFGVLHGVYWVVLMDLLRPFDRMTAEPTRELFVQTVFTRLPLELILYGLVLGGAIAFHFYECYNERAVVAARLEASLA